MRTFVRFRHTKWIVSDSDHPVSWLYNVASGMEQTDTDSYCPNIAALVNTFRTSCGVASPGNDRVE
jgi:hypothetical protein